MKNPEGAFEKIDRSRKIILMALICYLIAFVALSNGIGHVGFSSKAAVEKAEHNVVKTEEAFFRELRMRNSALLISAQSQWESFGFDLSRGDFDQVYARFTQRTINNMTTVDQGELAMVIGLPDGNIISDRSDGLLMELFEPEIMERRNILYDNVVIGEYEGDRIAMNKIIIPAPYSHHPTVAIVTGYSFNRAAENFEESVQNIHDAFDQFRKNNASLQILIFIWLVATIVMGGFIASSLRSVLSNIHCLKTHIQTKKNDM